MPKLRVISELAEVSISTVSRVLANKGNVSQDAREKVLTALAELSGKNGLQGTNADVSLAVGIFVSEKEEFINDDPMTSIDIVSLKKQIESMGNRVVLAYNRQGAELTSAASDLRKIDVAVVNDPYATGDRAIEFLEAKSIPFILTNGRFDDRGLNYVDYNNYEGAFQAVSHLTGLGHREIAAITGPISRIVSANRLAAYRDALKHAGIQPDERNVVHGSFSLNGGYMACQKLLSQNPRVSAIFAFNDLSAIGAVRALKETGRKVPDDVSVVGFDDMELARFSEPQLTTVSRFKFDINPLLAQAADDLGRNPNIEHIRISLKTELVIRQSTVIVPANKN